MAEVILMPRLSDTMTEGVIAAWHKKVGDTVKKGDLLAEIETDKATMELESYKDGTLLHIGGEKGVKIQVDDLLAIVGKAGEDVSGLIGGKEPAQKSQSKEAGQKEKKSQPVTNTQQQQKAEQPATSTQQKQPSASEGVSKAQPVPDDSKIPATPAGMEEVVLMPRLSDTMEEGVIAAWHKKVGDAVKKGDVLAEIETDKATMELESYKNGTLLHIGAQKGEKIPVNGLLCIIGEKDKVDVNAIVAALKNESGGGSQEAGGGRRDPIAIGSGDNTKESATSNQQPVTSDKQPIVIQSEAKESHENGRVKASPLAKKLAAEKGIDIKDISGTGDGGRIIKADIDSYTPAAKSTAPATA
ncbi:MAG: E3 binding domain-containing protein, partial [Ferruginibacter sp.]|nr:E3 binding domain-containing protein [Chitinophagaceae bacterium]